ncbi:hypothetical protein Ocin01_20197 [Orchesella cincta]|uniref:Uncharacterized protein n=1 Tax=Orchesella cincta TaxID=48709 RepID=A0A1D2M0J7_ORCCI|nr:hypothetical protein Ocin01_20197 [Orchesella cincta]
MITFNWQVLMFWVSDPLPPEQHSVIHEIFAKDADRLQNWIVGVLVLELCFSLWLYYRQYSHVSSLLQVPQILQRLSMEVYSRHLAATRQYTEEMVIHNALKKSYINILWLVAIYFNWISVAWNIAKDFTAWPEFVDPTIERNVWLQ